MKRRTSQTHNGYPAVRASRGNRIAKGLGVTAALAAGALAVTLSPNMPERGETQQITGDVQKQEVMVDAAKMLPARLRADVQAVAVVEKMQTVLQGKAIEIAGEVLGDISHPAKGRHAETTANVDNAGTVTSYSVYDTTEGNSFRVVFGAKDGKLNASDVKVASVIYTDTKPGNTSLKTIVLEEAGDGSQYYNLSGQAAFEGRMSDPSLTFDIADTMSGAKTLDDVREASFALSGHSGSL
jgi:hypothetical protein